MSKRPVAWLVGAAAVLVVGVATALPAAALELDPVIPVPEPPPEEPTTTLPPETTTTLPPETTTTLPPPPPPDTTTTVPPPPDTTTTVPPPPDTTTTVPPPPPPPDTTTTVPPPGPTTTLPPTTNPPQPPTTTRPPTTPKPPTTPPTTAPPPVVQPVDPDDVPVIVFPPKWPTVLPPSTATTIFTSGDPELPDDPDDPDESPGSTGSSAPDDPTTTDSPQVVLEPKVAVKTIPSALPLVEDGGNGSDGGRPSGAEVAATRSGDTDRVASAPAAGGASEEAAASVATSRTGATRGIPEPLRSPLGGILVAALVSFVVAGSYCGWLLLARR